MKGRLLHIGGGAEALPSWLKGVDEVTLDINPKYNPDYVRCMTDMGQVGKYDFAYSCHCLEHVYPHEVKKALSETYRVLKKGGINFVIVPDLDGVKPTNDIVYESPAGPVSGLDIIYGMARLVEANPFMAHKTGFTMETLKKEFREAGFKNISGIVINEFHSIMVIGEK